jgi:tRNA(Ile)-lysidine synthetase-like protein
VFEKEDSKKPGPFCVPLRAGINDLGASGVIYFYNNLKDIKEIKEIKNIYKLFIHKTLYSDKINGGLYIRNRQSGDVIRCGGMTKSVKKLLCDKKIAPEERSSLPFICDGDGILWIPGVAFCDGAEAADGEEILYICYAKDLRSK